MQLFFENYRSCSGNTLFSIFARGPATATASRIEGTLNGEIAHVSYDGDDPYDFTCTAADHRFVMTRR